MLVDKIELDELALPEIKIDGRVSVEKAISSRRSRRDFTGGQIKIQDLSQLLWSAQGVTDKVDNLRAAPSAGALYPMKVYAVLTKGLYEYMSQSHSLKLIVSGDKRRDLYNAVLMQGIILTASVNIVICAIYELCGGRYHDRANRYCIMEAGAIGENIHLQAESLGLGTVMVAAFDDLAVQKVLQFPKNVKPLLIMPVGIPV